MSCKDRNKIYRYSILQILIIVIMVSISNNCRADTVDKVLSKYGIQTSGNSEELNMEYRSKEEELKEINKSLESDRSLNYAYEKVYKEQLEKYSVVQTEIDNIAVYMRDNFNHTQLQKLSAEELDKLDIVYSDKKSKLEELQRELSLISDNINKVTPIRDIQKESIFKEKSNELSSIEFKISSAKAYEEIGNIKVKYPLNSSNNVITSNFGTRVDPITKNTIQSHSGLDISADEGTEVLAIFNGKVNRCGYDDDAGFFIWINHGSGLETLVCHLKEIKVKLGESVEQNSVIALSGRTGRRVTGPHLHLAVKVNGEFSNPNILFN